MIDNMKIWDALKATDPKHTKPVSFGARKFTSIDAHWQIQRMTEHFGPVGQGWGYEAAHSIAHLGDVHLAVCDVTIWWTTTPEDTSKECTFGPVRGTAELYTVGKRLDDDAPKKCLTDALTKGLSHLGVSADVFLGLYDDNKYVQKVGKEFSDAKQFASDPDVADGNRRWVDQQKTILRTAVNAEDVKAWNKANTAQLKKLNKEDEDLWDELAEVYNTRLDALRVPV